MSRASALLVSISKVLGIEIALGVIVTVTWPVEVRTTSSLVSTSRVLGMEMALGVIVTITWPVDVMKTTEVESGESSSRSVTVVASSFGMSKLDTV